MKRFAITDWFARLIDHEAYADGPPPQKLWPFVKWCLSGSFLVLGLGVVASALTGFAEVLVMVLLGAIVDAAVGADNMDAFWSANWHLLTLWVLLLLVVRPFAFGLGACFQSIMAGPGVFKLVLSRVNRHMLGQAVTFFDNDFAGRISQKQIQTTRAMVDVVTEMMNSMSIAVASVVASAYFIGVIDARLALVMAVWLGVYYVFMKAFLPMVRKLSAARAAARAMVTGQIVDTITNIKTVKLFASSDHEDRAALGAMSEFHERGVDWGQMATFFRIGLSIIAGALPAAVVSLTLYLVSTGDASVGQLTAAGAMAIRLSQMTGWVSWVLMGIYGNIGEIEDGIKTLAPAHKLKDADNAEELNGDAVVEFNDVTFAYGRETGGVSDINLTIHEGEKLGIVGASGAGKSTLVSLLLRLYDTENGQVRVAGQDVRKVTQESLRRQIGMVTQETAMFNRSARENILYGKPEADDAALFGAAERARAHEFILGMKDFRGNAGYEAFLGERGVKLSGGQRQRIALARAILKDAPILVLDEATSALDSEVEAEIQEALDEVMEGKTVLAIAHRLSTIARMDRIIVMEDGHIVEQGTHADLLAQNGTYARFWNRQSGGFIGVAAAAE